MPVTAKLSRRFYEQLGDDIANELVEWFNAVDAAYKGDLKEVNELNWNRFRAELHSEIGGLRSELRSEMDRGFAKVDIQITELRAEMIKWMFLFWAGTVVPLAALIVAVWR